MSYDPSIGRWTSVDPSGFAAGDVNLYRDVGNNPTNATDPSGLAAKTEEQDLLILEKEIKTWRERGWDFAANLLQHFIDKKGPSAYTLTAEDKSEVIGQSENLVKEAIYEAIWDDKSITAGNLKYASFKFKDHVRWNPSDLIECPLGVINGAVAKERVQDTNDDLFYAYGGADLEIEGKVVNVETVQTQSGRVYFKFSVSVTVTISDEYTFIDEGPLGARLWAEAYKAAHLLEKLEAGKKYPKFSHIVTFKQYYADLRSDRIAGGLFHCERPIK